jgi:hypothetical protein
MVPPVMPPPDNVGELFPEAGPFEVLGERVAELVIVDDVLVED